jgi:hypothetical protein
MHRYSTNRKRKIMTGASHHRTDQSVTSSSSDSSPNTCTPMKSDDSTQNLSSSCDFEESLTSLCADTASLDLNQHIPSRASREEKLLQVLGPFCPDDEDDEDDAYRGQESFASDDHFSIRSTKSGGISFSDLQPIPEKEPSE